MSIDGSINLGNLNAGGTGTPFTLTTGVLEPGNLTTGASTLPEFALEGGVDDGQVLPAFTLEATGEAGNTADGVATELVLPAFGVEGGTADGVTLEPFALDATAETGAVVSGATALPAFDVAGALEPPLALPVFDAAGVLLAGNIGAGDVRPAAFTLAGFFGDQVDVTLPAFTLAAAALTGTVAAGAVQPLLFTSDAAAFQNNSAAGDVMLALWALAADGSGTAVIDAAVTLSPFTLQAAALAGGVTTADLTLPLWTADGAMGFSTVGTATITLPAFVLAGGADAPVGPQATQADPGALATVVALNTRLKGVSLYTGLNANSFASFAGLTLAATPEGIVALAGDTDLNGAAIAAHVTAGVSDFDLPTLKTVLAAYVGYRASGEMELTLITDEHEENVYRLAPMQPSATLHAARVKCGRGVEGRYWQWKLSNTDGASFELQSLGLHIKPKRRGV